MDAHANKIIQCFAFHTILKSQQKNQQNIGLVRQRKKRRALVAAWANLAMIAATSVQRELWMRQRTQDWWDRVVGTWGQELWVSNFRMRRETFEMLCVRLSPMLSYEDTTFRQAISVQKHVGVGLWWLATGAGYRTLAHLFGISDASVCLIVREFCHAVRNEMMREYIKLPEGEELQTVLLGFKNRWGFPQCAGAIDGSHIPVIAPPENHADYFNRKGWHSVILQAVVDHKYCFTNINIGWPGSVHDSRVLRNSVIYEKAERGVLFPNTTEEIQGTRVPIMLLGDPAYPLRSWLMKGYPETGNLTEHQRHFNKRLSGARMTVECAFGRLKGRWRCLSKRLDVDISLVPTVISTCCTLHNICKKHNEAYSEDPSAAGPPDVPPGDVDPLGIADIQPLRIREALTQYFAQE
uniref:DDE Tnp4 domain-containing protein n=1 Tax=Cyprinus carpio carpio TaxID=630221 RepID=A0A9J7Y3U0_CYPCA